MFYGAGLVLCLGAALVSAETGCPYPQDVFPCRCEFDRYKRPILKCDKVHDTQVLLRVFEKSRRFGFEEFTLTESSLQYIPHQIFDDVKVRNWNMTNVTLRNLFDEVPRDPGIERIYVKGVKILGGMDWKKLHVFKKLFSLFISNVPLKKLPAASFSNITKNLEYLYCNNCQIKKLEEYLFKDYRSLRYLVLSRNAIADIQKTMFPTDNSDILIIDLSYNKISILPDDVFSGMYQLVFVYLKGNQISVLPGAVFQKIIIQPRYEIDVTENPIKCDCLIAWVLEDKKSRDNRMGTFKGNCYEPIALRGIPFDQITRADIRCELSSNSIL